MQAVFLDVWIFAQLHGLQSHSLYQSVFFIVISVTVYVAGKTPSLSVFNVH